MSSCITVFGALGKDPEVKFTASGTAMLKFSLASTTGWGDRKNTTWYDVTKFGKGSEGLAEILRKGSKVVVSGEHETRKSTNSESGVKYVNNNINAFEVTLTQTKAEAQSSPDSEEEAPPF